MKRLSKAMRARQNEPGDEGGNAVGEEAKTVLEVHVEAVVSMHVDETTGCRYNYNETTGHTQWVSDDDDGSEATDEEVGETKQTKILFRKIVDDDDGVYYENTETEEVVWKLPEDGELEEL